MRDLIMRGPIGPCLPSLGRCDSGVGAPDAWRRAVEACLRSLTWCTTGAAVAYLACSRAVSQT